MYRICISAFLTCGIMTSSAYAGQSFQMEIQQIANRSACSRLGQSSPDYISGMALVFARAACHPERPETKVASSDPSVPTSRKNKSDALSVYDESFRNLKIPNEPGSPENLLRHTYVLLTALGFKESSGRYCVGRYTSQGFSRSTDAEAGLFQTSWGAHIHGASLDGLFRSYQKDQGGCLLSEFKDHARCTKTDAINWNSERSRDPSGVEWQDLTKRCPAFAAEYASVVVRKHGGSNGEFGPIKCHSGTQPANIQKVCQEVRIYPVCDSMFSDIQTWLKKNPVACDSL